MKNKTVLLISDLHTNYHVINAQILHAEETHGGRGFTKHGLDLARP